MKQYSNRAFTLIEILIAIAVIGIVSTATVVSINPIGQIQKGNDAHRKSHLSLLQRSLQAYFEDHGKFPLSTADHKIKDKDTVIEWGSSWQHYMVTVPKDPLSSQNYFYQSNGTYYRLFAKLERCPEPGAAYCDGCNYSVTSSNIAPEPTRLTCSSAPLPTSTPVPPTPQPTSTPTPTISPIPGPKRVFVTSTTYKGDLKTAGKSIDPLVSTGLEGADAICKSRANAARLGGSWKAWLSTTSPSVNAIDRITPGIYTKLNGQVVARNKPELIGGTLRFPIDITEFNSPAAGTISVWTGTRFNGNAAQFTCNEWEGQRGSGHYGLLFEKNIHWTDHTRDTCLLFVRLYCFEQ